MKIFFSYGHDEHSDFVRRLAGEIEKRSNKSIQVWIDSNKITRDSHWREKITEGIIDSDSVIAFLSPYSTREESVCLDELSIALVSKHGMIRTILLEKGFTPLSRVSEYQWGDLSDYPNVKAQGEEAFSVYIEQEADKIIALVNSDEMKQYAEDVQALRRSFHMPDIDTWTKFDALLDKELIGREWLFERIRKWEADSDGSRVLLLCGKPGVGKSMFSAHLQMRDSAVVAAFPCDCRHSEYRTTQTIIMQIAYRLALRLPDYRRWVMELLNDPSYDLGNDSLYEDLILRPLSKANIGGNRAVMVIVVDALDEAENDSLAEFISQNADSLKKYVRFLVTSRKVPNIVERFSKFVKIDMDTEEEAIKEDLKAYYESRLGYKLAGMPEKNDFIQRLVQNSGGVFTYAECVTNNITEDIKQGKFTIGDYSLPAGIDDLFRDTLDRSFHRPGAEYTEEDYAARWRTPLGMILASPEPLPVSTLRSLMNWKNADLKDFRRPLFSLLTETEGTLTLFHRSFGEWLEKTDTAYAVSKEDGISELAEACLDIYNSSQDEMDEYMLLYTTRFLRESRDREHRKQYDRISRDHEYINRLFNKAVVLENKNAFSRAMAFYFETLSIFFELKEKYPENPDYLENYSFLLEKVAGIYEARNELDRALKYLEEALVFSQELKENYPENPDYLQDYSVFLNRVADIYKAQNDLAYAQKYYEESLAICRELKEKYPESPVYLRNYSVSLNKVAGIYKAQHDLSHVLKYHEEALELSQQLKDKYPENPDYLYNYCASLGNVAMIYEAQNDLPSALKYAEEALELSQRLKDEHSENLNYLYNYSHNLESVGEIYEAQFDLPNALEYYEKALIVFRKLKEKYPENSDYLRNYSVSLIRVAWIHNAQNDLTHALKYAEEALAILKELKEKYPENPEYLRIYSVSLERVAGIYEMQNDLACALEYYKEELVIFKELKEKYPENPQYLREYSVSLIRVAGIHKVQNDLSHALKYAEKALAISRELNEKYSDDSTYLQDYSFALNRVAGIYGAQNNLPRALEYYEEELALYKKLKEKNPENWTYVLDNYNDSLNKVARIYEAQNDLSYALEYYEEMLIVYKELKEQNPENWPYIRDYSFYLTNIARIYKAQNDLAHALKYYEEALAIFRELKERYPENTVFLYNYSASLERIAGIYEAQNELAHALEYYEEDLEICREFKDRYPENPDYLRDYAVSLEKIAGIYEVRNELDRALKYYEEALSIYRELKEKYPENSDYSGECSISLENIARINEKITKRGK